MKDGKFTRELELKKKKKNLEEILEWKNTIIKIRNLILGFNSRLQGGKSKIQK